MRPKVGRWCLLLLALLALSSAVSAAPFPVVVEFNTVRLSLDNVDDVAGRWQHEGGQVFYKGNQIGNYAAYRRVTFSGTSPQNTAMLTMTIFFLGGETTEAPQNITLQGSHQFNSGQYLGSISAASKNFKQFIGKRFTGSEADGTLNIQP
jgi:hypothetical protein